MRLPLIAALALVAAPALAQSITSWAEPTYSPEPPPEIPLEILMAPPTGAPSTPAVVPVDGGLGLLALAGGAYAAARLRRRED